MLCIDYTCFGDRLYYHISGAVEIKIDGALADAGALGDVIELGGSEALLHERIKRSINDGDAAGFLLQFAFPCPWQFERCTHGLEPDGDMPAS
jgi:hypothetical protein